MNYRSWLLRRWQRAIGWPGVAGVGLLVLAVLIYFGGALPERLQQENLKRQVAEAKDRARMAANPGNQDAEARLAAFYSGFPGQDTIPAWLEKIYGAGSEFSLGLEKGEYRLIPDRSSRLLGYEINLPVRGSYVQLRGFIRKVLNEIPTLALRDIQIRRTSIAEPNVEAQIRFILYMREKT